MRQDSRETEGAPQTTRQSVSTDGVSAEDLLIPALTILAHPERERIGEVAGLPLLVAGEKVELSRTTPIFAHPGRRARLALNDTHLSRKPLALFPGSEPGTLVLAKNGSSTEVEVDGERFADSRTFSAEELQRGVVLLLGRRIVVLLHYHHSVTEDLPSFGLIGESTALLAVRREIDLVARLDVPVLLLGESGTGKELIARAIHSSSRRRGQEFLAVNMAAVPTALAASELFGAVRGAFTGADRKKDGYFLRADGGTLLLDEIGDTPLDVQPLLLRALENGEIQSVGAASPRKVDVRLIAATDADLESLAASGEFRKPLLHRLAGYVIRVPSLRARRSDFGRLFYSFLESEFEQMNWEEDWLHKGRPWPKASLIARLAQEDWPGNVRELKNAARRLAVARQGGRTTFDSHEAFGSGSYTPLDSKASTSDTSPQRLSPGQDETVPPAPSGSGAYPKGWRPAFRKPGEVSEEELLAALHEQRYDMKKTAEALNLSRASLYLLVEKNPQVRKSSELETDEIQSALQDADNVLVDAAFALKVSLHGLKLRMKALGLR